MRIAIQCAPRMLRGQVVPPAFCEPAHICDAMGSGGHMAAGSLPAGVCGITRHAYLPAAACARIRNPGVALSPGEVVAS
jgi:hypothetical protein